MFQRGTWVRIIAFCFAASCMAVGGIAILVMFMKLIPYWDKLRVVVQYILDNPLLTGCIALISFSLAYLLGVFAFSTEKKH